MMQDRGTSSTGQQPLRRRQCSSTQVSRCLVTEVFLVVLADSTQHTLLSACSGTAGGWFVAGSPLVGNARAEGQSNADVTGGFYR